MKLIPPKRTQPPQGPVGRLTGAYRWYLSLGGSPLTHRKFARELSTYLKPLGQAISPDTTRAWEKEGIYPSEGTLEALIKHAPQDSWQWYFAQDMKAALFPQSCQPASALGRRTLGQDQPSNANTPTGGPHAQN